MAFRWKASQDLVSGLIFFILLKGLYLKSTKITYILFEVVQI